MNINKLKVPSRPFDNYAILLVNTHVGGNAIA